MPDANLTTDMENVNEFSIAPVDKLGMLVDKIYEGQTASVNEGDWAKLKDSISQGDLVSMGVRFNDTKELEAFADYAKKEGLAWVGIYDPSQEIAGNTTHIAVASKDAGKVKDILEHVTDDKRVQAINNKITEISVQPEVTGNDLMNIAILKYTKDQIQERYAGTVMEQEDSYSDIIDQYSENVDYSVSKENEYKAAGEKHKDKLDAKGYEIREDGEVYQKEKMVKVRDELANLEGLDTNGKLSVMADLEAVYLGELVGNYESLDKNYQELSMAKTNEILAETKSEKEMAAVQKGELLEEQAGMQQIESALVGRLKETGTILYMNEAGFAMDMAIGIGENMISKTPQEATREEGGHEQPRSMTGYMKLISDAKNLLHGVEQDAKANEHGRSAEHTQAGSKQAERG